MTLPDYINCQNTEIEVCDYLLTDSCKGTCAYALDVGGLNIGAPVIPIGRQSEKGLIQKLIKIK